MAPLKERFESRIQVTPGCWWWTAAKCGNGYGHIRHQGRVLYAHRVSFQLYVGEIPQGLHVLHSCDNPLCVNPAHLSVGTHQDNMSDMYAKGRRKAARGLRNGAAKLDERSVQRILCSDLSSLKLAPMVGVSSSRIRQIRQAAAAARSN